MLGTEALSVAVTLKDTGAEHTPGFKVMLIGAGQVITGGIVSCADRGDAMLKSRATNRLGISRFMGLLFLVKK